MSNLVPTSRIEDLVGATRHPTAHLGRAVSSVEYVYILHSAQCVESGVDLRQCEYSRALDEGIRMDEWLLSLDTPVVLGTWAGRLIPKPIGWAMLT